MKRLTSLLVVFEEGAEDPPRLRWFHVVGFLLAVLGVPTLMLLMYYSLARSLGKPIDFTDDFRRIAFICFGMGIWFGLATLVKSLFQRLRNMGQGPTNDQD